MKIIEVTNKKDQRAFLDMVELIYEGDPYFVRPLDREIVEVFDPRQNSFFGQGEATRWILQDTDGVTIGRVAAFINRKKAFTFPQPTGGMGFFECINDKNAAFLLDQLRRERCELGIAGRRIYPPRPGHEL
jgi:hypothetical protein